MTDVAALAALVIGWIFTYPDDELRQPTCPQCGAAGSVPGIELADRTLKPAAFCLNLSCDYRQWNPTHPAAEVALRIVPGEPA